MLFCSRLILVIYLCADKLSAKCNENYILLKEELRLLQVTPPLSTHYFKINIYLQEREVQNQIKVRELTRCNADFHVDATQTDHIESFDQKAKQREVFPNPTQFLFLPSLSSSHL